MERINRNSRVRVTSYTQKRYIGRIGTVTGVMYNGSEYAYRVTLDSFRHPLKEWLSGSELQLIRP